MNRKRVSFSHMDEIIGTSYVERDSTAREGLEETYEEVFEDDSVEGIESESNDETSSNPITTDGSPLDFPATPLMRTRELPPEDSDYPIVQRQPSVSSSPNASSSSSSPRPTSASSSGTNYTTGNIYDAHPRKSHSVIEVADSSPSFVISPHLVSGRASGWDVGTDPLLPGSQIFNLIAEEGHFPAGFSAEVQGPYRGQIVIRHRALPWVLSILPREGEGYVCIREVLVQVHKFFMSSVSDAELNHEFSSTRNSIIQTSRNGSRSNVLRVDCLLGACVFSGLSLGKDGETVMILLTHSTDPRQ
ncbi:hypothetical protein BJ165DRAFT_932069 [Panaeolus papilionaceus]|nr:hypothetical protein BJ165DRAFT_932069 [Panaeolus papilionaceus]